MREIQDILKEMDMISKEQMAITSEEEEELKFLLRNSSAQQNTDCCPTVSPTVLPCTPAPTCTEALACFDFIVPGGLDLAPNAENCIKGLFVDVNCSSLTAPIECLASINGSNCQIPVFVAGLTGCIQVIANIPVTDESGNCGFICASTTVCLNDLQVVCTRGDITIDDIRFTLQNANLRRIGNGGCNGNRVFNLTADVVATCLP